VNHHYLGCHADLDLPGGLGLGDGLRLSSGAWWPRKSVSPQTAASERFDESTKPPFTVHLVPIPALVPGWTRDVVPYSNG
jgi:hypothetical protein